MTNIQTAVGTSIVVDAPEGCWNVGLRAFEQRLAQEKVANGARPH